MPFTTALASLDVRASATRYAREVSLASAAVLLVGLGALTQTTAAVPLAKAVAVASPAGTAVAVARAIPTAFGPHIASPKPRAAVKGRAAAAVTPVERWLPTGTGMWVHDWSKTEGGSAGRVVRRAKLAGLTHLFVQTGSSKKGWIGQQVLSQLLPATQGTELKVIAWDFPTLINPEDDARRLVKAAWWRRPGVPMIAAVAPDIETLSEGTHATPSTIDRYYRTLRKELPARVAILATVPWPSEKRISRYPYTRTALHADAFVPMAYWYNRSPSVVTGTSMRVLRQFGKPVFPVGQGYDGRVDAPYLAVDPDPGKSVDAFVSAARAGGATSLSLWSWQTTGPLQWQSLARASGHFTNTVVPKSPKSGRSGWHPGRPLGTG